MNDSSVNESAIAAASAAKVLTLDGDVDLTAPEVRREALETIEHCGVVFLPQSGFQLTASEREMIANTSAMLTAQPKVPNGRPTIVFDPSRGKIKRHYANVEGKVVRAQVRPAVRPDLEKLLARFGAWAEDRVAALFPSYVPALIRDRITYRPNERSSAQSLHVDSSYGFPTRGRGMLRLFCNVDPSNRPRVWQVGEPFEPFAKRFLPLVRHRRPSLIASLLGHLGFVGAPPAPFDQLIGELRRLAKHDEEYQRTAPRRIVEFPSGSCWFGITDLVPHGAISGQHSLDQTYFLPAEGMSHPDQSSLRILERLTGRTLA